MSDGSPDATIAPVWQQRAGWALGILATTQLLAYGISLAVRPPGAEVLWADVVFGQSIWFVAGLAGFIAATRGTGYRNWGIVGAGATAYGLGWMLYSFGESAVFGAADVLWLAMYPLIVIGMLRLIQRRVMTYGFDFWLDVSLAVAAGLAAFAAIFSLSISPSLKPEDAAWASMMAAYLVFDVVLIELGVVILRAYRWRPPRGLLLIFLAAIVLAVTDWWYLVVLVNGTYSPFSLVDLGWPLAATLLTWAIASDVDRRSPAAQIGRSTTIIPGIALLVALAIIVIDAFVGLEPYVIVMAVISILLIALRLIRAIAEASDAATQAQLARTDHLTGLPNRRALYEAIDEWQTTSATAVIVIDLDGFKAVNDTLGHDAGDEALEIVGQRFVRHVRPPDVLARLGGDEFAVLLANATSDAAQLIADRLRDTLRAAVVLHGREFHLSASIGIAAGGPEEDVRLLMRRADVAMYDAKASGRDLVRIHQL